MALVNAVPGEVVYIKTRLDALPKAPSHREVIAAMAQMREMLEHVAPDVVDTLERYVLPKVKL